MKLIDGFEPGFRRRQIAGKRIGDLPPQQDLALVVDEPPFAQTNAAQKLLETRPVEIAARISERPLFFDTARNLGVRNAKSHLPRALVETRFGNHFAKHSPVEAASLRLFGRNRLAHLAAELLQAVIISLAELLDRGFRCRRSWPATSGRSREKYR